MGADVNPSVIVQPSGGGFALFDLAGRLLDRSPFFWRSLGVESELTAQDSNLAAALKCCSLDGRPALPWRGDVTVQGCRLRVQILSTSANDILVMVCDIQDLIGCAPSAEGALSSLAANLPGLVFERRHHVDGRIEYSLISEGCDRTLRIVADIMGAGDSPTEQSIVERLHPEDINLFLNARDIRPNGTEIRRYSYRAFAPDSGIAHRLYTVACGWPLADGGAIWRGIVIEAPPLADASLIGGLEKLLENLTKAVGPASEEARHFVSAVATLICDMAGGGRSVHDHIARLTVEMKRLLDGQRQLSNQLNSASTELDIIRSEFEKVQREASFDPLTGLPNRRRLEETVQHLLANAPVTPISLAVLDIDHFKRFNDKFGHIIGDEVLKLIGLVLRTEIPHNAVAARYGGEEFVLLLPGMSLEQAMDFCNHLRNHIAKRRLVHKSTGEKLGRITLSAGIAPLLGDEGFEIAFSHADAALYQAKKSGRNRVELFKPGG